MIPAYCKHSEAMGTNLYTDYLRSLIDANLEMANKERIMILGAGPFQVPGIQKAVALGHHVITVDYFPDNIGHRFSHERVNCSTTDRESVARAARDLEVGGICTFSSDVAVPTVGYVCEQLGLPGVSSVAAETMATKHLFRAFLRERGLPHPQFVAARSFDDLHNLARQLRFPVIFKPVDTSGSRGVTKVAKPDERAVRTAFEYARAFSRSGTVCVEEFIEGIEVGGDAILHGGRLAFLAITHKHLSGFVVTGHNLPTTISPEDQMGVRAALEACCAALGYADGPLNFDVMVTPERPVILEMSARNGGNGIPSVIARATGIDVEVATLQIALGDSPVLGDGVKISGAGSWVFGAAHRGVLRDVRQLDEVRDVVPELFDLYFAVEPGGVVNRFEHNGNLLGYALFDCDPPGRYDEIAAKISHALRIDIEATN